MVGMHLPHWALALLCGRLTLRAALAAGEDDLYFGRVVEKDAADDTMSDDIRHVLDNYGMERTVRGAPYGEVTDEDDIPRRAAPMHKMQVPDQMPWDQVPFQEPAPPTSSRPRMASIGSSGPSMASIGQQSQSIYTKLDQYQEDASAAQGRSTDVTYIKAPFKIGMPYIDEHRRTWVPITPDVGLDQNPAEVKAKSFDDDAAFGITRIWVQAPFKVGTPNYDPNTKSVYVPYFSIPDPKPVYPPNFDDEIVDPADLGPEVPAFDKKPEKVEVFKKGWMGLKRNRTSFFPTLAQWSKPSFHRYHMNQPSFPYAVSYPPLMRWRGPPPSYSPYFNRRPSYPMPHPGPQFGPPHPGQQFVDYGTGALSDENGY